MYICTGIQGKGKLLFNDALNIFYFSYIGIRHMVKNHIQRDTGNPLHGIHFLTARDLLYAPSHRRDKKTKTKNKTKQKQNNIHVVAKKNSSQKLHT